MPEKDDQFLPIAVPAYRTIPRTTLPQTATGGFTHQGPLEKPSIATSSTPDHL